MRLRRILLASLAALALVSAPLPAMAAPATAVVVGAVTWPSGMLLGAGDRIDVEVVDAYWGSVVARGSVALETGAYRIENVPADREIAVRFNYVGAAGLANEWWGDTYVRADRTTVTPGAGATVTATVDLQRGSRLGGRVTGKGAPLELVHVTMTSLDGFDEYLNDYRGVWTKSDGRYQTAIIPPGQYQVTYTASSPGWKAESQNGVWIDGPKSDRGEPLELTAGSRRLDVELDPWASISGRATLKTADGVVPVRANLYYHVWSDYFGQWSAVGNFWTEADGTFTIPDLRARDYRISFEAGGAFREFWGGGDTVEAAATIPVADGQSVTGIDVELDAWASIHASVAFQSDPGTESVPFEDVSVTLYKLDEQNGVFAPLHTSQGSLWQGEYYSPSLRAGTYVARFVAAPYSGVGSEYFAGARYFYESDVIDIRTGQTKDLDTVTLKPRYFDTGRIAGATRFETAVEISRSIVADGDRAPVVYVTNAFNFPDALAAGPAAIRAEGVILSTAPQELPPIVGQRLAEMDPLRVVILGDEKSVGAAVVESIRDLLPDADVDRIGGDNRYATAELIVRDAFATSGATTAIIATGANYPDALAAGPTTGGAFPVVLVNGSGRLDENTHKLLTDLGVTNVVIAGGFPSVSEQLESDLIGALGGANVSRIAGTDRYETTALLNDHFFTESDYAFLTTGDNFADALTGGPLAGAVGAPLYLSRANCIPIGTIDGLLVKQVGGVWLFGSEASLGRPVEELAMC
jgi:putative cell wall-binding protein